MIDRTKLKAIRADLDTALLALAKKHGVLFTLGTIRFDASEAHGTLRMTEVTGEAVNVGVDDLADLSTNTDARYLVAAQAYKAQAASFNLRPEWLGQQFTMNGSKFTVVGLQPQKHKNIILIRRVSTGKHFICAPDALHRGFAALV